MPENSKDFASRLLDLHSTLSVLYVCETEIDEQLCVCHGSGASVKSIVDFLYLLSSLKLKKIKENCKEVF